jgi:hypothetical protein
MSTSPTTLASSAKLRRLLTAALAVAAGALATAALDRMPGAGAPARPAPEAAQIPVTAVGRDPSEPDAGSVRFGREALPDEPVATF